ncbi:WD repeat-containing protein 87 [Chytriomyces hyalinus]|nr:WD repeat-containing protein 87 [Chytriomyces hyalinus]
MSFTDLQKRVRIIMKPEASENSSSVDSDATTTTSSTESVTTDASSDWSSFEDGSTSSSTVSSVSSTDRPAPLISTGKSASQTLRAAKASKSYFAAIHNKKAPGPASGGLEQETVLVYPWKRTRNLIMGLGVQRRMARSLQRRPKTSESVEILPKNGVLRSGLRSFVKGSSLSLGMKRSHSSNLNDRTGRIDPDKSVSLSKLSSNFEDAEAADDEDQQSATDEKSTHILPITIPHGFQLVRSLMQPKSCVKSVINVSSNTTDTFAVLDTYNAQLVRGAMKVARISVGEEKGVPDSPLTGLNRWFYVKKWRITVIATLHLELKILGLSLEVLSQTSSVKPVLSLDFHDDRDELIAGGVGNIRIWTLAKSKGTYRLVGPRLVIDDLATEEWISHTVCNTQLNRLLAACDCDILMYDYSTGKRLDRLKDVHELSISVMIFYSPQQYLITGSKDSTIKIWTRYMLFILELKSGSNSPVTGLVIANPDDADSRRHPFLLSSYQDGIIRMWNLETGSCVYKHETNTECLGLDWLRTDIFFHYARDRICVWNLNRHYTIFSSITAQVKIVQRKEVFGFPPRILAVSSDASIKLLSPVTGACLMTAFPVIRDCTVRSVEYDIVSNMLWALTTAGDVFVYSTVCNPCKVVDEWRVQAGKEVVTCMASLRVSPKHGKRSLTSLKSPAIYALFGGTETGQIVTMDIRKLGGDIVTIHQAHSSKISAISCCSEKMQLFSAGFDGLVKLWSISWTEKMETTAKDGENPDLCLQIQAYSSVSSFCIGRMPKGYATGIRWNLNSESVVFSSNQTQLAFFDWNAKGISEMRKKHAADEDHVKTVSGLSSLHSLQLFASSSEDGTAKIWDAEANGLVREIQFNEVVSSVCFNNPRGDLLVALSSQLILVRVHDYLPNQYLADLVIKDAWEDDPIESPKQFDSDLDFWEMYRIGLERIGADLSKWHVRFVSRRPDEEKLTAQIAELERIKRDAEEQRKRLARQEKLRRRQLRHMTVDEQKQLLQSLGLFDSLNNVDLAELMKRGPKALGINLEAIPDLGVLDRFLDGRIADDDREKEIRKAEKRATITQHVGRNQPPASIRKKSIYAQHLKNVPKPFAPPRHSEFKKEIERKLSQPQVKGIPAPSLRFTVPPPTKRSVPNLKATDARKLVMAPVLKAPDKSKSKLFPGKTKEWIQNYFSKLGLLPNSIMMNDVESEKLKRERALRDQEAARLKALQSANLLAMDARVRNIKNARSQNASKWGLRSEMESDSSDDDFTSEKAIYVVTGSDDEMEGVDMSKLIDAQTKAETAPTLDPLAEEERLRLEALEKERKLLKEKQLADMKHRREEEDRLARLRLEAEEAEKRRKRDEKDSKRKAELDAKLAEKRAKREAIELAKAAKAAEEEAEAERLRNLKEKRMSLANTHTMKDFVPTMPESDRNMVTINVFSSPDKRGSLYKEPQAFVPKKVARKPIVPIVIKRKSSVRSKSIAIQEVSSESEAASDVSDTFDPQVFDPTWDVGDDLEVIIARNAWTLIEKSKELQQTPKKDEPAEEFKKVMSSFWFPGLGEKEVTLKNIVDVLFSVMRKGYWREKCEACKSLLYLFQTFQIDFLNPVETVILPLLDLFHDSDWQFRATLCSVIVSFGVSHSEILYSLISKLADKHEQVRKSAKKSLAKVGIDSRDSLRKAMISLQLIPNSDSSKASNFLDDELAKIQQAKAIQGTGTCGEIETWRATVPPKKIPGSLVDRPDSYNATLVKSGVQLTRNDLERLWRPYTSQNTLLLPPASEHPTQSRNNSHGSQLQSHHNSKATTPDSTTNNLAFVKFSNSDESMSMQNSYDLLAPSRRDSVRVSRFNNPSRMTSTRQSVTGERPTFGRASSSPSSSSSNSSGNMNEGPAYNNQNAEHRRPSALSNHVITFNNGALQKKKSADRTGPLNDENDTFDVSNDTFQQYAKAYIQNRRATAIFEQRNGSVSPLAIPPKPISPSNWQPLKKLVGSPQAVDPWKLFNKINGAAPGSPKTHAGPLVSQKMSDDDEMSVVDEEGIKIYSRRVSMQPLQVNYYRRVSIHKDSNRNSVLQSPFAGLSLPPLLPESQAEELEPRDSQTGVPIVPVRLKTAEEGAIRPNMVMGVANSYTMASTTGTSTPRRASTTAATTLFDLSRPRTMDGEARVRTSEGKNVQGPPQGNSKEVEKQAPTSGELNTLPSVTGWSDESLAD